VYYLPIWFQAIKGATAMQSGFMNLPIIISLVVASIMSGFAVSAVGFYTPFLIASSALRSLGAGLLTSLETDTPPAKWISYQIIYGLGDGCGMQQPLIAVQTALPARDIPMGISVLIFIQTMGGAIFISVAQSMFASRLLANLREFAPAVDTHAILNSGATSFRAVISDKARLADVLFAYNRALTQTFILSLVLACGSIFGSAMVEWNRVKLTTRSKTKTGQTMNEGGPQGTGASQK